MLNPTYVIFALVAVFNVITFFYVGADKKRSREADARIPEVNFFVLSVFLGSLGILCGMYYFHHKTKKLNFVFGISALLLEQLVLAWLIMTKI